MKNTLPRFVLLVPLALCLLLTTGCQPTPSAEDLPALLAVDLKGYVPRVKKQIETAFSAVEADPTDAEANGKLALTLATYNFTDAASIAYERTRLLAPGDGRWAYAHGHLLGWSGDPLAAIDILEPALKKNKNNFWLGYELADQYLATGRFDESLALFETLAKRHNDKFQSFFGLGRVHLRLGNVADAIVALEQAAKMQPDVGEIHFALGGAYRQNGDADDAAREYELATRYEDNDVDMHSPLMQTMSSMDRGAKPLLNQARLLFEKRRYPEAIKALEAALVIDPTRQDAHAHLVLLYGRTGQTDKALAQYEKAVELDAADALLHLNMGMVLRRSGKLERARETLALAVATDGGLANAHAELGMVEEQLGYTDDAVASLQSAIGLEPTHQNANFTLGRHYAETGDNALAVVHLETAVKEETAGTPAYLRTLAGVYTRLGRHSDAVTALTRAKTLLARSGATSSQRGAALNAAIDQDLDAARDAAMAATDAVSGG